MIEQYISPAVVNNSQEPWLVGEGVSFSGSIAIPSLDFNFVTNAFPGTVTFTRASSATFFDSAGVLTSAAINVPRLDYDPATLAARGFLVEEQRTNLLTYSEEFENGAWTPSSSIVSPNVTMAPNRTNTADKIIATAVGATHFAAQAAQVVSGVTYSKTIHLKAGEYNTAIVGFLSSVGFTTTTAILVNLSTGAVSIGAGSPLSAGSTSIGNGWWRVSLSLAATASGSGSVYVAAVNGTTYADRLNPGDGTSGIYLWGAQLEAGAFSTSYIPTTTTALTRSADVASVNTVSPWYNATAGTLYAEYSIPFDSSVSIFPIAAGFSDGTFNNTIFNFERTIDDSRRGIIRTLGVQQFDAANGATYTYGTNTKQALAYATNDVALSVAGAAPTTSASVTIPTVNIMGLGSTNFVGGSLSSLNGWLRRITYYPRRLSNAELQAITA